MQPAQRPATSGLDHPPSTAPRRQSTHALSRRAVPVEGHGGWPAVGPHAKHQKREWDCEKRMKETPRGDMERLNDWNRQWCNGGGHCGHHHQDGHRHLASSPYTLGSLSLCASLSVCVSLSLSLSLSLALSLYLSVSVSLVHPAPFPLPLPPPPALDAEVAQDWRRWVAGRAVPRAHQPNSGG